jgi:cell shape-determining protein MreC
VLHAQIRVLDRNQLYEENLSLKERLGREAQPNAALAAVILRPPEVPYDTLLIDIGEDADIAVGSRVAAQGSLVIGTISEVYAHSARVVLFSSPEKEYDGFLRGTIPVKVEGQGGGALSMQVPYDAQVKVGDTVTLPGIESNSASIVEFVEPGQGDSAVTAYLRLPVGPQELRFVDVWRSTR